MVLCDLNLKYSSQGAFKGAKYFLCAFIYEIFTLYDCAGMSPHFSPSSLSHAPFPSRMLVKVPRQSC